MGDDKYTGNRGRGLNNDKDKADKGFKTAKESGNSSGDAGELNMEVSGICRKDGNKVAYVSFSDAKRHAEGIIPDCRILSQSGFDESEIGQLELFMKMNLANLKRKAALINPVRAMMDSDNTGKGN